MNKDRTDSYIISHTLVPSCSHQDFQHGHRITMLNGSSCPKITHVIVEFRDKGVSAGFICLCVSDCHILCPLASLPTLPTCPLGLQYSDKGENLLRIQFSYLLDPIRHSFSQPCRRPPPPSIGSRSFCTISLGHLPQKLLTS